jgi:hypothetical protein
LLNSLSTSGLDPLVLLGVGLGICPASEMDPILKTSTNYSYKMIFDNSFSRQIRCTLSEGFWKEDICGISGVLEQPKSWSEGQGSPGLKDSRTDSPISLRVLFQDGFIAGYQTVLFQTGLGYDDPIEGVASPLDLCRQLNYSSERLVANEESAFIRQMFKNLMRRVFDAPNLMEKLELEFNHRRDKNVLPVHQTPGPRAHKVGVCEHSYDNVGVEVDHGRHSSSQSI